MKIGIILRVSKRKYATQTYLLQAFSAVGIIYHLGVQRKWLCISELGKGPMRKMRQDLCLKR